MKKLLLTTAFMFSAISANAQVAATEIVGDTATLEVHLPDIESNASAIQPEYANCIATSTEKSTQGKNISPEVTWSEGPEGTKSYALIMVDPDVPADFSNANKDGKVIAENAPRQNFYHWGLVNIPANVHMIAKGDGKKSSATFGHAGINSYADFYKDKPADNFKGYDGPCPPFNDARLHHYHFQVYALNVDSVKLAGVYKAKDLLKAIEPHVIAKGAAIGTYSLYKK